jgi:aspartyl protease family protein
VGGIFRAALHIGLLCQAVGRDFTGSVEFEGSATRPFNSGLVRFDLYNGEDLVRHLDLICRSLLMVALMLAGSATAGSSQQHRKEIMPFLGETREHFEARKRGLPLPAISNGEAKLVPDRMGHFVAETTINGEKVRMLVDTGASFVSLSPRDAELLGLRPTEKDFIYRMQTANGIVKAAPVRLREMQVGDISVRDVDAVVHRAGGPPISLLGMSFLRRLAGFEQIQGRLILRQ